MVGRAVLVVLVLVAGSWRPLSAAAPAASCVRLEARLEELRLKLRLGYDARQGRVYRQQRVILEQQRRRLCRG